MSAKKKAARPRRARKRARKNPACTCGAGCLQPGSPGNPLPNPGRRFAALEDVFGDVLKVVYRRRSNGAAYQHPFRAGSRPVAKYDPALRAMVIRPVDAQPI